MFVFYSLQVNKQTMLTKLDFNARFMIFLCTTNDYRDSNIYTKFCLKNRVFAIQTPVDD